MADAKITALSALTSATTDDILPIVDSPGASPVTKKITYANLIGSFSAIGQLPFPATQSASADANTLDDYEEGTWTPVLTFATPGNLVATLTGTFGRYTKIGRLVFFDLQLTTSTFTHTTASGDLRVTGLPFTVATLSPPGGTVMGGWTKAGHTSLAARAIAATTYLRFDTMGSGVAATVVAVADMPTGGTVTILASGLYVV